MDYPVTLYSNILGSLWHTLSSRIASKMAARTLTKISTEIRKKNLIWLLVLRKNPSIKQKYKIKTFKNNIELFEVKSHSTEIVSFVIKSKHLWVDFSNYSWITILKYYIGISFVSVMVSEHSVGYWNAASLAFAISRNHETPPLFVENKQPYW